MSRSAMDIGRRKKALAALAVMWAAIALAILSTAHPVKDRDASRTDAASDLEQGPLGR